MNTINYSEETLKELSSYIQEKQSNSSILLSEEDMQIIFKCSRMTLYRARRDGRLDFTSGFGRSIVYPYEGVLLSLKTNKFKVRGLNKIQAIERLETYKKLLEV